MGYLRPIECERTRHAISAGLDAELSPFEETLVAAHVERCGACRSFQHLVADIATTVRETPLERLRMQVMTPGARRTRWASARRFAGTSAAAAVLVLALFGFATAPDRSTWRGDGALIASALDQPATTNDLLIAVRRAAVSDARQQDAVAYGSGGIGAYKPPLAPGA